MTVLSDDRKWEVYSVFLSSDYFCEDRRPDPVCLEALLRELGVTLDQVERLIQGDENDIQTPESGETPKVQVEAAG